MAMGKKQDIGDIIRDVMSAMSKPKRSVRAAKLQRKGAKSAEGNQDLRDVPYQLRPFPVRPRKPSTGSGPQPMPRKAGDKPPSVRPMPRRAGDKPFDREEAILPRRPRNPRKPTGPSTRQMPKRKPKAGPKRGANY